MRATVLSALAALTAACGSRGEPTPSAPPVAKATLAITHVRVFDGAAVLADTDVVVDGDKIVAIGRGVKLPPGVELVDGKGRTLLPGLIDGHAHVFAAPNLEQSLAFGVTTVLDMFSIPEAIAKLKQDDQPDRAAVRSAGTCATAPGGHGTEYGLGIPTISTPGEAQAFVDARIAEGSDYLKIIYDDGSAYGITIPSIDAATLEALATAAHARGKLAVVHIGDYDEARTAIERGADGIVHLFRDVKPADDFGALLARKHAFATPTLSVLRGLQGETTTIGDDPQLGPLLTKADKANLITKAGVRAKATPGAAEAVLAQLYAAKVPILVGTDAPNAGTAYGASVHDELATLVAAGLPPLAVLAGATALPAQVFSLPDRGRIAVGLRADLVLVDGDPTTTITDSRRIVGIWRGGVKFDRAAYKAKVDQADRPAPAPAAIGPISDFEDGTLAVKFGQVWEQSTDAVLGGTSTVTLTVVDGGATGKKALTIAGEIKGEGRVKWAGATFVPGATADEMADLSKKPTLRFSARGDGGEHVVMVFAQRLGRRPAVRTFRAGKQFAPVHFTWSDFDGLDGTDITGVFIGHTAPGKFTLTIDDVGLE